MPQLNEFSSIMISFKFILIYFLLMITFSTFIFYSVNKKFFKMPNFNFIVQI